LPDFIHGINVSGASTLINQGFAQPLNKLADEYAPTFYDVLPTDYELIHRYEDGNIYYVNSDFGDKTRIEEIETPYYHIAGFMVNIPLLEQIGNPPITTLEELKAAALLARETGISFPLFWSYQAMKSVTVMSNMVQMLTRMCGGTHPAWLQDDGSIKLNVRQSEYQFALKYLNDMYHNDLFNPENFTINSDEQYFDIAEKGEIFVFFGHPWHIIKATKAGQTEDAIYWPMYPPGGNGVAQEEVRFRNNGFAGIGARTGVFITKDSENPDRAIQYLAFLLTDEGQLLNWEGIEGITYYYDENGVHRYTEERIESERRDPMEAPMKYGFRNANFNWCPMILVNASVRHLRCESQPPYAPHAEISRATQVWERKLDLAMSISDEEVILLQQKVFDEWRDNLANIILAENDNAFQNAYDEMISNLEKIGIAQLEEAYSAQYKYWDELGIE
jgi:putative aldouronate transport system substrate-binding protein